MNEICDHRPRFLSPRPITGVKIQLTYLIDVKSLFGNRNRSSHSFMTRSAKIVTVERECPGLPGDEPQRIYLSGHNVRSDSQARTIESMHSVEGREFQDNGDAFFYSDGIRCELEFLCRYLDGLLIARRNGTASDENQYESC